MKITKHCRERMDARFITREELIAVAQHGKIVERQRHDLTGNPILIAEHEIRGHILRMAVDAQNQTVLTAFYRTDNGKGCRPEFAHLVSDSLLAGRERVLHS